MTTMLIAETFAAFSLGVLASLAGGAIGGVLVGGKAVGNELAAFMGAFYGPLAGIPGLAIGFAIKGLMG